MLRERRPLLPTGYLCMLKDVRTPPSTTYCQVSMFLRTHFLPSLLVGFPTTRSRRPSLAHTRSPLSFLSHDDYKSKRAVESSCEFLYSIQAELFSCKIEAYLSWELGVRRSVSVRRRHAEDVPHPQLGLHLLANGKAYGSAKRSHPSLLLGASVVPSAYCSQSLHM